MFIVFYFVGKASSSSTSPTTIESIPTPFDEAMIHDDVAEVTTTVNTPSTSTTSAQNVHELTSPATLASRIEQIEELNNSNDTIELLARTDEIEKECHAQLLAEPPEQEEVLDPSILTGLLLKPQLNIDTAAAVDLEAPKPPMSFTDRLADGVHKLRSTIEGSIQEAKKTIEGSIQEACGSIQEADGKRRSLRLKN